jgi:hypothetical protein
MAHENKKTCLLSFLRKKKLKIVSQGAEKNNFYINVSRACSGRFPCKRLSALSVIGWLSIEQIFSTPGSQKCELSKSSARVPSERFPLAG